MWPQGCWASPSPDPACRSSGPQCVLLDNALESQRFELPMKRPAGQRCDGPCPPCPGFRNDKRSQISVEAARADTAAQARVPSVKCKGEFSGKSPYFSVQRLPLVEHGAGQVRWRFCV